MVAPLMAGVATGTAMASLLTDDRILVMRAFRPVLSDAASPAALVAPGTVVVVVGTAAVATTLTEMVVCLQDGCLQGSSSKTCGARPSRSL